MEKVNGIKYHITYDQSLTIKDLEDLINLIRISNNDALQTVGISRAKGNDLQRIERIQEGSVEILAVIGAVAATIDIAKFVFDAAKAISKKIKAERDKDLNGTKKDKKVYYKHPTTVNHYVPETVNIDDSFVYVINIHVHNADEANN